MENQFLTLLFACLKSENLQDLKKNIHKKKDTNFQAKKIIILHLAQQK